MKTSGASESCKATITVSEGELLKIASKIEQNKSEDNAFRKQLDKYFNKTMASSEVISVCSTPNILKVLGSEARKVVLNQNELKNAISDIQAHNKDHTEAHKIERNEIYKLSEAIRSPFLVLKGNPNNPNSVVLLTELINSKGENVFVPISLDRQNGKISKVASMYGKKNLNDYLQRHSDDILAINTKKENFLADTGVQFPKSISETVVLFDDSIAYFTGNVKGFSEKSLENTAVNEGVDDGEDENDDYEPEM